MPSRPMQPRTSLTLFWRHATPPVVPQYTNRPLSISSVRFAHLKPYVPPFLNRSFCSKRAAAKGSNVDHQTKGDGVRLVRPALLSAVTLFLQEEREGARPWILGGPADIFCAILSGLAIPPPHWASPQEKGGQRGNRVWSRCSVRRPSPTRFECYWLFEQMSTDVEGGVPTSTYTPISDSCRDGF